MKYRRRKVLWLRRFIISAMLICLGLFGLGFVGVGPFARVAWSTEGFVRGVVSDFLVRPVASAEIWNVQFTRYQSGPDLDNPDAKTGHYPIIDANTGVAYVLFSSRVEPISIEMGETYAVVLSSRDDYFYDAVMVSWVASDFEQFEGRDVRRIREAEGRSAKVVTLRAPRYDVGIDGLEDAYYEAQGPPDQWSIFQGWHYSSPLGEAEIASLCYKYVEVTVLTLEELEEILLEE